MSATAYASQTTWAQGILLNLVWHILHFWAILTHVSRRKLGLKMEIDQKLESISAGTNTIIEDNKEKLDKSLECSQMGAPNKKLRTSCVVFVWIVIYLTNKNGIVSLCKFEIFGDKDIDFLDCRNIFSSMKRKKEMKESAPKHD